MDAKYKGKIITFLDLINDCEVEIPIIQRDYAQGRKEETEVREIFLKALFDAISSKTPIKLDFIYGSKVQDSFQPLDGQQRLTTLFILHWYAALQLDHSKQKGVFSVLGKFTYETRISSRDFCRALIQNPFEVSIEDENLSSKIIDASWFFLAWKSDPTISAMLRTIDDIHKYFKSIDNLWDILIEKENLISFNYVELENIGLTDDLYIKMNARGKLLSSFENFKASFLKKITDNRWENHTNPVETFSFKIDTLWTDTFWKRFKRNNSVDMAFVRFISTIAMIRVALEKPEDRLATIERIQSNPNLVRPEHFSKEGFIYLYDSFDIYTKIFKDEIPINIPFPLWRHAPKDNFLSKVAFEEENASYTQKALFYAQNEYLLRNKDSFNLDKYHNWMRVIRNIVSRGHIEKNGKRPDIIRSFQTFDGVINLIAELAEGSNDIYSFLASKSKINSNFAKYQIDEETFKAKLITNNDIYKENIFKAEDNGLLMGRIEFILYCINTNNSVDNFDITRFNAIQNVINTHFSLDEDANISDDFRRALLTIEVDGKHEYYGYWYSYWYATDTQKRCLINKFRELEYYIYSDYREYFKKLVLSLEESNYQEIINLFIPPNNMPNWKQRLIKEPELLNRSKSNYIAIASDNSYCYLLKSVRPRDVDGSIKIE
uniref:DUF262 domain-containing protein n=1 Tax=uncultured Dysgonomonas sp. TaxID=206096 RepID=UPI0025832A57|nr:DUF262 domain-containing protein [uncultured Dysgonomonas sp.]